MRNILLLEGGPRLLVAGHGSTARGEQSVPFASLLDPIVEEATRELLARVESIVPLTAKSLRDLQHSFLRLLAEISSQTLYARFDSIRANAPRSGEDSPERRSVYERFTSPPSGLASWFEQYPALRELVTLLTRDWIESTTEFILRLRADGPEIARCLSNGSEQGAVVRIHPGLSDRHHGGRSVIALHYSSGSGIVYKARETDTEAFFFELNHWLNERNPPYPLRAPKVLPKEGYGWVGFAYRAPCLDEQEARLYYRRAGALLLLLHVLQFSDGHFQNLIASGAFPVMVDTETLFQPLPAGASGMPRTVLQTGLLPRGEFLFEQLCETSALGATYDQQVRVGVARWQNVGTNDMVLTFEPAILPAGSNVPELNGAALPPGDHIEDMCEGFRATGQFLIKHRTDLLAHMGPLESSSRLRVRFVVRNTLEYYLALNNCIQPAHLMSSECRMAALDQLRPATGIFSLLLKEEKQALFRMDIPRFTLTAGGTSFEIQNGSARMDAFAASGAQQMMHALESLDEGEIETQIQLIRSAWQFAKLMSITITKG